MNKNAIKNYAIWARNELITRVTQKAFEYGVSKDTIVDSNADSINGKLLTVEEKQQRQKLISEVKEKGFDQVMEEVAYTWFNRFIALRYMEVNNYLPNRVRVFTNENNEFKPQLLDEAMNIDLEGLNKKLVFDLLDKNKKEELYKQLIIATCNDMGNYLPGMFTKISDYKVLLFPDNILKKENVVGRLISDIDEDSWLDQVQIIGWMYQYYISEPKDKLINAKKQYKNKDVPFVTQIFTPDWIVKYMVQNSLGRLFDEENYIDKISNNWEYYLKSNYRKDGNIEVQDIKIIDPCMGSGHILVYAFDLLISIYESVGYSQRDAAEMIIANNLIGLDISERAYQLAYFSLMMKARKYNRGILKKKIGPNLYLLKDVKIDSELIEFVSQGNQNLKSVLLSINEDLKNASEVGSLVCTKCLDYDELLERLIKISNDDSYDDLISLQYQSIVKEELLDAVHIAKILSTSFDVVITNPPYIGNKFLPVTMKKFIDSNYKEFKSDIFATFIVRVIKMCKDSGHIGMLTPYVWMFISSYEELRHAVLRESTISSLIQLEYNAFEAACVPVCAFTLHKFKRPVGGEYIRLSDFKGVDIQGPKVKEAVINQECGYRYKTLQSEYKSIPGNPIAYWVDKRIITCFETGKRVDEYAYPKQGLATADNNKFLRLWFEVDFNKIGFNYNSKEAAQESGMKWFPYNKGGGYKKWYGNNEYLINWENDGYELRNFKGSVIRSPQYYFKEGISWCKITSSNFSMRYIPNGFLFDVAGCTLFTSKEDIYYYLGFMNSNVNRYLLSLISPTLNYEVGHIGSLPIIKNDRYKNTIVHLVKENISLCRNDWDSYENSWDFKKNPLIGYKGKLSDYYVLYSNKKSDEFATLKKNEEKLNCIFSEIYDVDNLLESNITNDEVIIGVANYKKDMKYFISYFVGCLFGRYSLDQEGLVFAGGNFENEKYKLFKPDIDNIVPICDDEYFEDDIVSRFIDFVKITFGDLYYEDNLNFIANALGYSMNSREAIRYYFLNDFYNDHCNLYTSRGAGKRPIYWLFDSGKKNGFKALVYIHRYTPDLIARMRTQYIHEQQSRYRNQIEMLERQVESDISTSERVHLTRQLKKFKEQDKELRVYEEKIHHWADKMEPIDLDDGVKANYAKFQELLAKIK